MKSAFPAWTSYSEKPMPETLTLPDGEALTKDEAAKKFAQTTGSPAPKDYSHELEGLLQLAYGACAATGNLADAAAIKHHGQNMARAWDAVAQENAAVRKGLEWLT